MYIENISYQLENAASGIARIEAAALRRKIVFCVSLIATIVFASQVVAQGPQCAPREAFVSQLEDTHGEYIVASDLDRRGLVETYANDETGTWTSAITSPNGFTCLIAHGKHFQRSDAPPNT